MTARRAAAARTPRLGTFALSTALCLVATWGRADAAAPGAPVAGRARHEVAARADTPRAEALLPPLLGQLPRRTPLALWLPNIDLALADADAALELARLVQPTLGARRAGEVLARLLAARAPLAEALYGPVGDDEEARAGSLFSSPASLARVGIDVGGGLVLAPNATDDALVIVVELSDRPRFEAWLASLAGGEPRRLPVGGEQATVLEPPGAPAAACLSRRSVAYCQLGESAGADPIAALRAVAALASPMLADAPGLVRAFRRLPEEAHAYLLVAPEPAARLAARSLGQRTARELRFEAPERRRSGARETADFGHQLLRAADALEGVAVGLSVHRDRVELRAELALSERGAKVLRDRLPRGGAASEPIARWVQTPALARALLRLRAADAERLARGLGAELPPGSLSGTLGLLVFGVDPDSPLARRGGDGDALALALLAPSAVAVGLRPGSADVVRAAVARALAPARVDPEDAQARGTDHGPAGAAPAAGAAAGPGDPIAGQAHDSTYEVRVFDELLVAGAGPGSGAAAMRRMRALPAAADTPEAGVAVAAATLHLRALDAALDAGSLPAEARRELRLLDQARRRLRPLLEHVDGVRVEVRALEPERRVRVELSLER